MDLGLLARCSAHRAQPADQLEQQVTFFFFALHDGRSQEAETAPTFL